MSKSIPGLLKAIEDFHLEHGQDKEHETNIDMLKRVSADVSRGKASEPSPGSRETMLASEQGHDAGDGQKLSNRPGAADAPELAADQHDNSTPSKMTSTGPVPSGGQIRSALSGPPAQSGQLGDIRRMAALKELESKPSSEGNKESVAPAPSARESGKMGDVRAPAKGPPDRNTGDFEGTPPFAKESLAGDGWSKARERAKKLAPAAK